MTFGYDDGYEVAIAYSWQAARARSHGRGTGCALVVAAGTASRTRISGHNSLTLLAFLA